MELKFYFHTNTLVEERLIFLVNHPIIIIHPAKVRKFYFQLPYYSEKVCGGFKAFVEVPNKNINVRKLSFLAQNALNCKYCCHRYA